MSPLDRTMTGVPPDFRGVSVAVIGMGKSGVAASRLLCHVGARVTVVDEQDDTVLRESLSILDREGIDYVVGRRWVEALEDVGWIVVSPGVPADHPALDAARQRGASVIGEVELACWFVDVPIIAVTGTNGKSTTVRLIGEQLNASRKNAFVGGNLGTPLSEAALTYQAVTGGQPDTRSPYDFLVVEVSSFQLETIRHFRPWVAAILNITPDHLDRHASFDEYQEAKWKMFVNQTSADFAVINIDDPRIAARVDTLPSSVLKCSVRQPQEVGVWLEDDEVKARIEGEPHVIMAQSDIGLPGDHNLTNVLVAVAVGLLCGCSVQDIHHGISTFHGVEHVLEFVREHRGVKYYNDSKGTNVDATQKALASFDSPILLIVGGKDKGGDFEELRDLVQRRVKTVIVIGEAASRITRALHNVKPIVSAGNLRDALMCAEQAAIAGDVVLFSPACASFDMFQDYAQRGNQFKTLVHELS